MVNLRLAPHYVTSLYWRMHRRQREEREMAGWQCAAGRAILRLEASAFGPLAGTTKNTVLRFESGEFMPRPATVLALERALRERGIYPTYDKRGEPKGINLNYLAYPAAYPQRPQTKHKRPEEVARQREVLPAAVVISRPDQQDAIAALEAQQQRLMKQLEEFRRLEAYADDDDWSA